MRKSVKHACHALSIDDERKWFLPSIWKEYEPESSQKVEQVWFGGSHTDVGGGFWEAGFSDIALEWMVGKALEHNLRLYPGSRRYWNFCIAPDATDDFHDPRSAWGKFYPSVKRDQIWDAQATKVFGPPTIHESVFERAKQKYKQNYEPWILSSSVDEDQIHAAYDKWLDEEYRYQSRMSYERDKARLPGVSLADWRLQPGNSFEAWKANDENSFDTWKKDRVKKLDDEFGAAWVGRQFLLEPWKPVVYSPDDLLQPFSLRDYMLDNLLEILNEQDVYTLLKERARKIDQGVVAKLRRAERKKLLSDPEKIPYLYRIDRDKQRWEKRGLLKPPSDGSASH